MTRSITISIICKALNLDFTGEDREINGLFLSGRPTVYKSVLAYGTAGSWLPIVLGIAPVKAVVVRKEWLDALPPADLQNTTWILCEEPEKTFYDIHDYLIDKTDFYARYDFAPVIGKNCTIHPTAVIENGVQIGDNADLQAYCVIKAGSVIGKDVTIGTFTVVGEEGFQVLRVDGRNRKIRHCGQVRIGDRVEIGALDVIHKSLFENATVLEDDVKIDTKVHVGHNCVVGENAVITPGCVLCGSTTLGAGSWLGPNSSVLNKVIVGKDATIGMGSVVTRSVTPGALAYGVPAREKV